MTNSFQGKNALLIGNGINLLNVDQSFKWGALLNELKNNYLIDIDLDNFFKPFPLAFDEILHQKQGENDFKDKIKTLKKRIRNNIENQLKGKVGFNSHHMQVATLPYNDILTTNYDYSLQESLDADFLLNKREMALNKQETKYSLKRAYRIKDRKIWHIHGELFDSRTQNSQSKYYNEESIMIGFEHYSAYLEKIQINIKGKQGPKKDEIQSLMNRLSKKIESPFWTDIFFTHNLDIIGQGFDFSENHLWWLINFRANYIRFNKSVNQVKVNNIINFYYPIIPSAEQFNLKAPRNLDLWIRESNSFQKSKAIAEILKAFKVEPIAIHCVSFADFYNKFIQIKKPKT